MKAIVSHDIDHLTAWEHLGRDLIIPKFIIRSKIELFSGKISWNEFLSRGKDFFTNKWQNIEELIKFDHSKGIQPSFFIGMKNGRGLSYSRAASELWTKLLLEKECETGIHGIEQENCSEMLEEKKLFEKCSGLHSFGNRMHYLLQHENAINNIAQAGYLYDSSVHGFRNPYKIGDMWEFPLQIMDSWEIENGGRWQKKTFEQAKDSTKKNIDKAFANNLDYLVIDFHDRYFSKSFRTWMEWYAWLLDYLNENKITSSNFKEAVAEMNSVYQYQE